MFRQSFQWPGGLIAVWFLTSACGSSSSVPAATVAFDPAVYRPAVGESVTLTPRVEGGKASVLRWWVETPSPGAGEYYSSNGTSGISLVFAGGTAVVTALDVGTYDIWAEVENSSASAHVAIVRPAGSVPPGTRCEVDSECSSDAPRCAPYFCRGDETNWSVCSTACATTADCTVRQECRNGACAEMDPECGD